MRKNPHAVALGRRGGQVITDRKLAAIRQNAKKGGRKPKFAIGDPVLANDQAPADYRGRKGRVTKRGPGRAEYRVEFTGEPQYGYLMSWWLEPRR